MTLTTSNSTIQLQKAYLNTYVTTAAAHGSPVTRLPTAAGRGSPVTHLTTAAGRGSPVTGRTSYEYRVL